MLFDNNRNTFVRDYLAGIVDIGSPTWHHFVQFLGLSNGANTAKARIGRTAQSVALSGIRYKFEFYKQGVKVDSTNWTTVQVIGLLGINDYAKVDVAASSIHEWDMVDFVVDQTGISLAGGVLRVYEVSRSVQEQIVNAGNAVFVSPNQTAALFASSSAPDFLWYKALPYYDSVSATTKYTVDTSSTGFIGTSAGYSSNGISFDAVYEVGPITQDSVFFVKTVNYKCNADTSGAVAVYVKLDNSSPLATNFTSFDLKKAGSNVRVNWTINTSSTAGLQFEIERRNAKSNWTKIATVIGTTEQKDYTYKDNGLNSGNYQYRLKVVENSGAYSYSTIKNLTIEATETVIIYPNPCQSAFTVNLTAPAAISIFNTAGIMVHSQTADAGQTSFNTANWTTGLYLIRVAHSGEEQWIKMIVEN
jgi:hypothetical protein